MQTGRVLLRAKDKAGIHEQITHVIRNAGYSLADSVGKSVDGHYFLRCEFSAPNGSRTTASELEKGFREALTPLDLGEIALRVADSDRKRRTAILVSGKFYCLEEVLHHWSANDMNLEISCVISNVREAEKVVRRYDSVAFHYIDAGDKARDGERFQEVKKSAEQRIFNLTNRNVDFYTLAKWHRVLLKDGALLSSSSVPILSVHPSLLPSFPGNFAVRDAHESGAKVSGATAHLVTPEDEDIDKGPKIAQIQRAVGNLSREDFEKEIQFAEREAIYKAVRILSEDRFIVYRDSPSGTRKTYIF